MLQAIALSVFFGYLFGVTPTQTLNLLLQILYLVLQSLVGESRAHSLFNFLTESAVFSLHRLKPQLISLLLFLELEISVLLKFFDAPLTLFLGSL